MILVKPKIYHILHYDRLSSVISVGGLVCDSQVLSMSGNVGTKIGMPKIKRRRLSKALNSYPCIKVGDCVPFYFCPRSVMLYVIYKPNNPGIDYADGQSNIIHLESDFYETVDWARRNEKKWVFTDTNAGSHYFNDFSDLNDLENINWNAIGANLWTDPAIKEMKQAEFLIENTFPWELVSRIGVISESVFRIVQQALEGSFHRPPIVIKPNWYY